MADVIRPIEITSSDSAVLSITPISNKGWAHSSAVPSRFVGISVPQAGPIIAPELNGISSPDIIAQAGQISELSPLI